MFLPCFHGSFTSISVAIISGVATAVLSFFMLFAARGNRIVIIIIIIITVINVVSSNFHRSESVFSRAL